VYQRVLGLTYVEDLLARVKTQFVEGHYSPKARRPSLAFARVFARCACASAAR
jgi:hypothetical protein